MDILVGILLVVFCAFNTLSSVAKMLLMIRGHKAIKEYKDTANTAIKLRNMQDSKASLRISLITCVVVTVLLGCFLFVTIKDSGFRPITVILIMVIICFVFNVVTTFIGYKNIDECYITSDGIVMYDGILKLDNCRFVMESSLSGKVNNQKSYGKNFSVYKGDAKVPFRFQIIDNHEEVVKLIQRFDFPQDLVERVTLMEQYFDEVTIAVQLNSSISTDESASEATSETASETTSEAKEISSEIQRKINLLSTYYECGLWLEDYEADEDGKLPDTLKRGVLSQDALYNLFIFLNIFVDK